MSPFDFTPFQWWVLFNMSPFDVFMPRLRNCWQKNKQVLDQAGAQEEQIFDSRINIEKHLQNQRDLFHNFIDFKKAFDRVWHTGLWQVLRSFNIDEGLVQAIQALYQSFSSAVL